MCTIRLDCRSSGEVNLLRPCITARVWALKVASAINTDSATAQRRQHTLHGCGVFERGEVAVYFYLHNGALDNAAKSVSDSRFVARGQQDAIRVGQQLLCPTPPTRCRRIGLMGILGMAQYQQISSQA